LTISQLKISLSKRVVPKTLCIKLRVFAPLREIFVSPAKAQRREGKIKEAKTQLLFLR